MYKNYSLNCSWTFPSILSWWTKCHEDWKKLGKCISFFLYFTHSDLLQPNQSSVIFQSDWEGSEAAAARKFISPIAVFGEADGQKPLSLPHLLLKEWIVCLSYLFSGLAWPKSSKKKIQSSLLTHSHFPLLEINLEIVN